MGIIVNGVEFDASDKSTGIIGDVAWSTEASSVFQRKITGVNSSTSILCDGDNPANEVGLGLREGVESDGKNVAATIAANLDFWVTIMPAMAGASANTYSCTPHGAIITTPHGSFTEALIPFDLVNGTPSSEANSLGGTVDNTNVAQFEDVYKWKFMLNLDHLWGYTRNRSLKVVSAIVLHQATFPNMAIDLSLFLENSITSNSFGSETTSLTTSNFGITHECLPSGATGSFSANELATNSWSGTLTYNKTNSDATSDTTTIKVYYLMLHFCTV